MRADGEIQVAAFGLPENDQFVYGIGVPVELGGRGKVVRMWAIHYHAYLLDKESEELRLWQALSENPEHLARPPVTTAEFAQDKALYGRATWAGVLGILGAAGMAGRSRQTQVVPLYGLLRPRRQVWVNLIVQGLVDSTPSIEIYYSPVDDLPRPIINTINRARGKYRRT